MNYLSEHWTVIAIISIIITALGFNRFVFNDRPVSGIKDHIEEGWQKNLDEDFNQTQSEYRRRTIWVMWLLILSVVLVSVF